jgi:DNA-binding HxlR family transcriptional regulator
MEYNGLIEKRIEVVNNKNLTEYYLTKKGSKLNRILYEMAVFGLDELECGDEGDLEIINMFKDYYAELLNV